MHEDIERFSLYGSLKNTEIDKAKANLEEFVIKDMQDNGHIPVLDIDPQWTLKYIFEADVFDFSLTIYGVKEKEAWAYSGMINGERVPKYSPMLKS